LPSRRTTARGTPVLALAVVLALGTGTAAAGSRTSPTTIVFPVLASATYHDDFGEPRPGGPHQGIDILAPKRSLALAAEAGKVEFWTASRTAGCMLYLHGVSGTTYDYIHLNNDLTARNDNRGKCVAGSAYARGLKSGAKVASGQPVGYVGDSGDADGAHAHLHFELHPGGGRAVDPYPWLNRARHLLFTAPRGTPFMLELRGRVASVSQNALRLKAGSVDAWPMRQHQSKLRRTLLVLVPASAAVESVTTPGGHGTPAKLSSARAGQQVDLWTALAPTTLKAERGDDLALTASVVSLVVPQR
jgi:hypothetical protein